jgi:uracil-DNA glycosylase
MQTDTVDPLIEPSWKLALKEEFEQPYFSQLNKFLIEEKSHHTIYPLGSHIFNAFHHTPLSNVKVVILGQDPYHGSGQAHGLAFSVQEGVAFPPSLQNIFKELSDDIGCAIPKSGNLTAWAEQGVFLLNTVLTVRADAAHSHKDHGWERFTDRVIETINQQCEHVVFILWGRPAQAKASLIDSSKHLILTAPHPSPLSSYRGFFGSKPFSKANAYLVQHNLAPIHWQL